jgi:hypothetical protein
MPTALDQAIDSDRPRLMENDGPLSVTHRSKNMASNADDLPSARESA